MQLPKKNITFFNRDKKEPVTFGRKKPADLRKITKNILNYLEETED